MPLPWSLLTLAAPAPPLTEKNGSDHWKEKLVVPGGRVIVAEGCRVNGSLVLRLKAPAAGEVEPLAA